MSFFCAGQAEVDVNTSVDVSSLISSANLPLREGEAEDERERFYLTTAINYTNGAHDWRMRTCCTIMRSLLQSGVVDC